MVRSEPGSISAFIATHFRHFNARELKDAADGYRAHVEGGGKILMTLGGAMSTAELGRSLAAMIRADKVHAISCTGANLEEDLFHLVARDAYRMVTDPRYLTPTDDQRYFEAGLNRVTDTCLPDNTIWQHLEQPFMTAWSAADRDARRAFPHEFVFEVLTSDTVRALYQADPNDSWLLAAAERRLPIFTPGWEDSSLGNMYAAACIRGEVSDVGTVRSGTEAMMHLIEWYTRVSASAPLGFFQIGGGIAGDFPICVVPLLRDDLGRRDVRKWTYFCQISDSTTSYGSYSGAPPSEKISWGKLDCETPTYVIESDATIVAPLIFAYVMGW